MAQRTITTLVDDIDGSPADETLTFALDGVTYELELNSRHADELRSFLAKYVDAGRRVRTAGSGVRHGARSTASGRRDLEQVRSWARENGHQVADRGRISAKVIEAYDQAH